MLVKVIHSQDEMGRQQDTHIRPSNCAQLEFNALKSIHQQLTNTPIDEITAARPLVYFPELNALALQYLPGQHLLTILNKAGFLWSSKKKRTAMIQVAHRAGQLLGVIHCIQSDKYPSTQTLDASAFRTSLQGRIALVSNLARDENIRVLLNQLLQASKSWPYSHLCTVHNFLHNDYYLENIIRLPTGKIYTVDTTLHQVGPIEQDIAKFIIGVQTTKNRILYGKKIMHDAVAISTVHFFLAGYRKQNSFNETVLSLYWVLSTLQRWTEVLEVNGNKFPIPLGQMVLKTRINSFFRQYLTMLSKKFNNETELPPNTSQESFNG